ncbi:hypothetical protein E2C01_101843 [Portunus trituberculatus]|uniref:Uncharacterized protein n=1 Tax=Portunus trituberculatus TaxID=210409 RepID=A0A5B7K6N3_PORTR|nr:hypothetical protein [Portunus trituberculatus]
MLGASAPGVAQNYSTHRNSPQKFKQVCTLTGRPRREWPLCCAVPRVRRPMSAGENVEAL